MSIKEGSKVRVSRKPGNGWAHGVKFGAVGTVLELFADDALVSAPVTDLDEFHSEQYICLSSLKPAKQANKKAAQ